jgi:hypothetical protein
VGELSFEVADNVVGVQVCDATELALYAAVDNITFLFTKKTFFFNKNYVT